MSTEKQTQCDIVTEPQAEITANSVTLEKLRHTVETMQKHVSKSGARLQLDSDSLGENLLAVIEHLKKQAVHTKRQAELRRQEHLRFTRTILHIIRRARKREPEVVPIDSAGASAMDSVFLLNDQNLNMFDLETDLVRNLRPCYPSDRAADLKGVNGIVDRDEDTVQTSRVEGLSHWVNPSIRRIFDSSQWPGGVEAT